MSASEIRALAADLTKAGAESKSKAAAVVKKAAYDVARQAAQRVRVDTGATKNSIGVDLTDTNQHQTVATIGPTTHYAPYLEYGTRRMTPRPFMGPALDAVAPGFEQAITDLGGDLLR